MTFLTDFIDWITAHFEDFQIQVLKGYATNTSLFAQNYRKKLLDPVEIKT